MQQHMASKRIGHACSEQAVAKVVGRPGNETSVAATVSAITNALQQHFMSPGGWPPLENSHTKVLVARAT
eukprot:6546948-Lingulodinium_polyedra.AAC.1